MREGGCYRVGFSIIVSNQKFKYLNKPWETLKAFCVGKNLAKFPKIKNKSHSKYVTSITSAAGSSYYT